MGDNVLNLLSTSQAMKKCIWILIGFISATCFAQKAPNPNQNSYLHNYNIIERMGSGQLASQSGIVPGISAPPPEVQGDVYLHPDYRITTFQLYNNDKLVEGYPSRFDIRSNEFDLVTTQGIRALRGDQVKSIVWVDSVSKQPQHMVNGKQFVNESNVAFTGFFEILAEGSMMLLKKTELMVKDPDFHPALNVGSRDVRIIKKQLLYYTDGQRAIVWPGKKQGVKLFESKATEVKQFIKINQLDLDKEGHVRALVDYYNSITN
jgi:hypothetical protein